MKEQKITIIESKFVLGQVVATQGVTTQISKEDIEEAMIRYVQGDWGILDAEDKAMNDAALSKEYPDRILAKYKASNGVEFYIITEWDRSVTTFLLPSEY